MVARTPASLHRLHLILPEILKGLKFKQRSRDRHQSVSGGIFNPWCGTHHSGCICEIYRAWLHPQNNHVTHTTSLLGVIFTLVVGFAVADPLVKFKQRSFIHLRNIEGA